MGVKYYKSLDVMMVCVPRELRGTHDSINLFTRAIENYKKLHGVLWTCSFLVQIFS